MSPQKLSLESVRRRSGGRIHLTPRVPRSGPVTTLCGQTLADGTYAAVETEPDCSICLRRQNDQARVSGAFFAQDEGAELLRLSLEQAKGRKPNLRVLPQSPGAPTPARPGPDKDKPVVWPAPKPPVEVVPDRAGELVTHGFKPSGEGVWRSPQGVIVRLRRHGKSWRFAELVFEGSVLATRSERGVTLRAGDVEVAPDGDGYEVRIRKGK